MPTRGHLVVIATAGVQNTALGALSATVDYAVIIDRVRVIERTIVIGAGQHVETPLDTEVQVGAGSHLVDFEARGDYTSPQQADVRVTPISLTVIAAP